MFSGLLLATQVLAASSSPYLADVETAKAELAKVDCVETVWGLASLSEEQVEGGVRRIYSLSIKTENAGTFCALDIAQQIGGVDLFYTTHNALLVNVITQK